MIGAKGTASASFSALEPQMAVVKTVVVDPILGGRRIHHAFYSMIGGDRDVRRGYDFDFDPWPDLADGRV